MWLHFFLNHLSCTSQIVMYVTTLTTVCCSALYSFWKKSDGFLTSNMRALFQYVNFPPVQNNFRENSYLSSFWRSSRFPDVMYIMLVETITLVTKNVQDFSLSFLLSSQELYLTCLTLFFSLQMTKQTFGWYFFKNALPSVKYITWEWSHWKSFDISLTKVTKYVLRKVYAEICLKLCLISLW